MNDPDRPWKRGAAIVWELRLGGATFFLEGNVLHDEEPLLKRTAVCFGPRHLPQLSVFALVPTEELSSAREIKLKGRG